ncbi:Serine acetyltransferase 3, mitochondrial, partial [Mucuna pruriens]
MMMRRCSLVSLSRKQASLRLGLFIGQNQSLVTASAKQVPETQKSVKPKEGVKSLNVEKDVWLKMQEEARVDVTKEPLLSTYYNTSILSHTSLQTALANHLAVKLATATLPSGALSALFAAVLESDEDVMDAVKSDLRAVKERDPACVTHVHCFLNFKGFLACQAHRLAHKLWLQGRKVVAVTIQNRVSEVFAVDIHPGAEIGSGILLDHATGIVVGETAVIGNNVSILHGVTLGGTGKVSGDRHPKIGDGVLIGAGTCILGNIRIGDGAKIGAGSVVIKDVPPRTTVVGNPAKLVGGKNNPLKLDNIPSFTMDHTSHISDFYDYYCFAPFKTGCNKNKKSQLVQSSTPNNAKHKMIKIRWIVSRQKKIRWITAVSTESTILAYFRILPDVVMVFSLRLIR